MADLDIGGMFLNSMFSEEVRSFCWVDITNMRTEKEWERHRSGVWEKWDQKMMGITDSPYHAYQAVTWAK